ncbi:hypothetical protein TeGR_g9310, partial [Tetraparma gracilis]
MLLALALSAGAQQAAAFRVSELWGGAPAAAAAEVPAEAEAETETAEAIEAISKQAEAAGDVATAPSLAGKAASGSRYFTVDEDEEPQLSPQATAEEEVWEPDYSYNYGSSIPSSGDGLDAPQPPAPAPAEGAEVEGQVPVHTAAYSYSFGSGPKRPYSSHRSSLILEASVEIPSRLSHSEVADARVRLNEAWRRKVQELKKSGLSGKSSEVLTEIENANVQTEAIVSVEFHPDDESTNEVASVPSLSQHGGEGSAKDLKTATETATQTATEKATEKATTTTAARTTGATATLTLSLHVQLGATELDFVSVLSVEVDLGFDTPPSGYPSPSTAPKAGGRRLDDSVDPCACDEDGIVNGKQFSGPAADGTQQPAAGCALMDGGRLYCYIQDECDSPQNQGYWGGAQWMYCCEDGTFDCYPTDSPTPAPISTYTDPYYGAGSDSYGGEDSAPPYTDAGSDSYDEDGGATTPGAGSDSYDAGSDSYGGEYGGENS